MEKKRPFFIPLALITLITPWVTAGCHEQRGGYNAASSISQNGFAINGDEMRAVQGQEIRVWGFVDHSNLYGDDGAKKILGEWWSGDGPNAASWRFNLKAKEEIDQLSPDFVAFRRTLGSALVTCSPLKFSTRVPPPGGVTWTSALPGLPRITPSSHWAEPFGSGPIEQGTELVA